MAASMYYPKEFKSLPYSVDKLAFPVFEAFGKNGIDTELYTLEELTNLINDCTAVLTEIARVYPKHPEKEYFETVLRFAGDAKMEKIVISN
jgi:hypothetical protein